MFRFCIGQHWDLKPTVYTACYAVKTVGGNTGGHKIETHCCFVALVESATRITYFDYVVVQVQAAVCHGNNGLRTSNTLESVILPDPSSSQVQHTRKVRRNDVSCHI